MAFYLGGHCPLPNKNSHCHRVASSEVHHSYCILRKTLMSRQLLLNLLFCSRLFPSVGTFLAFIKCQYNTPC